MENITTDEFIRYRSGFMFGKDNAIKMTEIKSLELNLQDDDDNSKDEWFGYGYQDGFEYYYNKINKENYFEDSNAKKIINDAFYERVAKKNKDNNIEIPVSKFRI